MIAFLILLALVAAFAVWHLRGGESDPIGFVTVTLMNVRTGETTENYVGWRGWQVGQHVPVTRYLKLELSEQADLRDGDTLQVIEIGELVPLLGDPSY